jgi:hypothetical protein
MNSIDVTTPTVSPLGANYLGCSDRSCSSRPAEASLPKKEQDQDVRPFLFFMETAMFSG